MAANNILQNDAPVYHRFVDNQVLTDNQLNEVLDHLNFQDKLTRNSLIGVGIACGLEIQDGGSLIRLSSGVAVTSDGDLIKMDDLLFRGYKEFKDENVRYDRFLRSDKTISLFELELDLAPSDVHNLSSFETRTGIAREDMFGLLYLESFLKEEEDCSPVDCDAQGREVSNKARVLICSLSDAKKIAEKDSILRALLQDGKKDILAGLSPIYPSRVVVNPGNASSISKLKSAYATSFEDISLTIRNFASLVLFKAQSEAFEVDLKQYFRSIKAHNFNFQYVYDFKKDLATACNELLDLLEENYSICCPDYLAFPKHVMLGTLNLSPQILRHSFFASPIHHQSRIEELQKCFGRILEMIRSFDPGIKKDPRITPSKAEHFPLGDRALPFYYDLGKSGDPLQVLEAWKSRDLIPNYYRIGSPKEKRDLLDLCLDAHDFYRIEGHVGLDVLGAMKGLDQIRREKGLAFDILPLAIGASGDQRTIDFDKYSVYFEDLQVILQAWNEEQKCLVSSSSKFLSRFSAAEKGKHLDFVSADEQPAVAREDRSNILVTSRKDARSRGRAKKKSKKNAVMTNIDKTAGGVGAVMGMSVTNSSASSDFQVLIAEAMADKVVGWESELVKAAVNIPAKLLGRLKVSEDNKLENIEDFSEANLRKYIDALEAQCRAAQEAKKDLQTEIDKTGSKLKTQPYVENYTFTINRIISSCCMVERVKVLYEKILERKEELLDGLVLKEYARSHPGLDHGAGVPKGGTFVLLYYSDSKDRRTKDFAVERDILFESRTDSFIPDLSRRDLLTGGIFGSGVFTGRGTVGSGDTIIPDRAGGIFLDSGAAERPGTGIGFVVRENLAPGTVIGDLYLPYICCSNIPSTTFVYPDQAVDLFIGQDHVCRTKEGEADELLLDVTPNDGTVKAFIGTTVLTKVIKTRGGQVFFDASKVAINQVNKEIAFTVNEQDVEPTLRVVIQPQASFATQEIIISDDKQRASLQIDNNSIEIEGQNFIWDFGDGENLESIATTIKHTYKVGPGKSFEFDISLRAFNGPCTDSTEQTVTFVVPKEGQDDCLPKMEAEIVNSRNAIESLLRQGSRELAVQSRLYKQTMQPQYELILRDLKKSLEGGLDRQIFDSIKRSQARIGSALKTNLSSIEKTFILQLYYENALLYFYVQACRDSQIRALTGVTDQWTTFTKKAARSFKEELFGLLNTDAIHVKLSNFVNQEGNRMSSSLKSTTTSLAKLLKNVLG